MRRIRLDLQYIGTNYNGWQSQPHGNTVQDHLERALKTILSEEVKIIGASRTDSGVHALDQVACFETPRDIDLRKVLNSLNSILPRDIGVKGVSEVPGSFHPILSAEAKIYRYWIWRLRSRNPFLEPFSHTVYGELDLKALVAASRSFIGEHDFTSFCAVDSGAKTKTRRIYGFEVFTHENAIEIQIMGNGFLKQMVRTIVGTLLDVGQGKIAQDSIGPTLAAMDRRVAGPAAPACGLTLSKIFYDNSYLNLELIKSLVFSAF